MGEEERERERYWVDWLFSKLPLVAVVCSDPGLDLLDDGDEFSRILGGTSAEATVGLKILTPHGDLGNISFLLLLRQCHCDLGSSTLLLLGVLGALMVELLSPARPPWRTVTLLWKGELDLTDIGDSSVLAGPGVTVRRNILGELMRAFVIKLEKEGDELSSWCSFP